MEIDFTKIRSIIVDDKYKAHYHFSVTNVVPELKDSDTSLRLTIKPSSISDLMEFYTSIETLLDKDESSNYVLDLIRKEVEKRK